MVQVEVAGVPGPAPEELAVAASDFDSTNTLGMYSTVYGGGAGETWSRLLYDMYNNAIFL